MPTIQDFIQEIQSDDLGYDVSHHLDKFMTLYYMLGMQARKMVDLRVDNRNGKFGFLGVTDDEANAKSICERLNNATFTVYNKELVVHTKCRKDSIAITVNKK